VSPRSRAGVALALLAFSLLPVINWIPGGHALRYYGDIVEEWWNGGLVALGIGVILALASRRAPALWRDGTWTALSERADLLAPRRTAGVALLAGLCYAVVARFVLSGRPLLIDEIAQVWQARVLASGHLWAPSTGHPELFGVLNVVDHAGKVFAQFPIGGPAFLALGSLVHAEWLVGPVFGALGVWWWSVVLRRTGEPLVPASNALLLFAFAPFALFMSGSHMNHVTTLTWVVTGMAGLAAVTTSERPRPLAALAMGLAFGVAASIRPVDAFAFGAPAGLWLFVRALRDRSRVGECLLAAVGMAVPVVVMLWVNAATTGHPLLFGYSLLWGPKHDLGFHPVLFGPAHTPLRGVELINLYLIHLQVRALETPLPSLIPAFLVLGFGARLKPFDRYLLVSAALLLGLYWAYWHNGFYLGPRFVYLLLPPVVLFTARAGSLVVERHGQGSLPHRGWIYVMLVSGVIAVTLNIPLRAKQYASAFQTPRLPFGAMAVAAGAKHALVLVRESWGAQLNGRMQGLGAPASTGEFVYWRTDMCALQQALDSLEQAGARDSAAARALTALTADSSRVVAGILSPDGSEHVLPGRPYAPVCLERLADDFRGFTVYPPVVLDDVSGNVYIRDQHAGDTVALRLYPGRPIFVLAPPDSGSGSIPAFRPASTDSLLAAWGLRARGTGKR
jgi:hypothetical protein